MITQAACPACGAGNRIASGHPPDTAKCGKCHANLSLNAPVDVDDASFSRHLKMTHGPILLDVWAPWCGPCQSMAPQFAAAATRLAGQARLLKMNADQTQTPGRLNVTGIPALILFQDGKEIARQAGAIRADALCSWVASNTPHSANAPNV
jgi:thioredoxin 2